jgi:hypothetical protein
MLLVTQANDVFADDSDPSRRYRLPHALAAHVDGEGQPQILIARHSQGGLMRVCLDAVWPTLAAGEERVRLATSRFRLSTKTAAAAERGEWHSTAARGDTVVDRAISLTPTEAAIARILGASGDGGVDVEIVYGVTGRSPVFPWLARIDGARLHTNLAALLPQDSLTWNDIENAFLGLTLESFTWYPLEPRALMPSRDSALVAIAQHLAPTMFDRDGETFRLREPAEGPIDVSLAVARSAMREFGLRWSLSEFLASQSDRARFLVDISTPDPFTATDLLVVNDVVLAPADCAEGIRSIAVEISTGGPTGVLHHEFKPGASSAARLRFVRETLEDLQLRWRSKTTVATVQGAAVIAGDDRVCDLTLRLDSATIGIQSLHVSAEPEIFAHVRALDLAVGTRIVTLTAAASEVWLAGRAVPQEIAVTAILQDGARHALGNVKVAGAQARVGVSMLGIDDYVSVTIAPPADLAARAAYLALQIEGQGWRTLEPAGQIAQFMRRLNRWSEPAFQYRTRHVARDAAGVTKPIAESAMKRATGVQVVVEI